MWCIQSAAGLAREIQHFRHFPYFAPRRLDAGV
jgi:hypothetical protein